ncbi:MAG: hypothetical protein J6P45_01645 [Lachnospiraceae bacterium]|nr:hypothetical protein [Lachnospiraceae bacterium]
MYYYEEGNTVRKRREDYRYYEPVVRKQNTPVKRTTRAQSVSRAYGFFLVLMAGVLLAGCIVYLNIRNDITAQQKEINGLESELSALRLKNDEEYDRIEGNVDMEAIKRIAMDELNMTYPNSDQVIDIAGGAGDYVRQYKDIPEDEEKGQRKIQGK